MLPDDLELQVKHFRGELSGAACTLFESMAKRIKLLEAKVYASAPVTKPTATVNTATVSTELPKRGPKSDRV